MRPRCRPRPAPAITAGYAQGHWSIAGRGRGHGLLHQRNLRESSHAAVGSRRSDAGAGPLRTGPRCRRRRSAFAVYQSRHARSGREEAAIFQAHEAILRDPSFTKKIRSWIVDQHQSAPYALNQVLQEYTGLFEKTEDAYIRERLADVRDVIIRLSGHLTEVLQPEIETLPGPLILVADELLPSQVVMLGDREFAGIATQAGGQTSHAAILARSRGIPAVSGVRGIAEVRQERRHDRRRRPRRAGDRQSRAGNRKRLSQAAARVFRSERSTGREPRSAGRHRRRRAKSSCLANINNLADAKAADAMGASGVGLYRTEYLFLTHPDVPDEEEQLAAYEKIIAASPNHRITIRTLDLGGDKTIPYLGHAREANPFMGWRSIRLSFEHPEFFATQIRAILRAVVRARRTTCGLMFPMITTLEEIRKVRKMVSQAKQQLDRQKKPLRPGADRLDARSAGGGDLHRIAAGRSRFRFDRLERSGAISDGGRPRQSAGQPSLPAAQPGGAADLAPHDSRLQRRRQSRARCAAKWPAPRGPSCCCSAWACAASA